MLRLFFDGDDLGVGGKAEDRIAFRFPDEGVAEDQGSVVDVVDAFPINEVAVWQKIPLRDSRSGRLMYWILPTRITVILKSR
jgi:hypothetical protein